MNNLESVPLVSIVLTTYNGQTFLRQQLDSLFQQTYPEIEIIAVDDGSRDHTVPILQEYAGRHPNMKVFINETNLGFIKNFEKGCSLSTGNWIALCDQDDYWRPDKIGKMMGLIGDHPMIYHDSRLCDQDLQDLGRNISDIVHFSSLDNCLQLSVFCRMYGHALLITRSLFEKAYPFLDIIPHDWWLSYTAILMGGIRFLPEPLVLYRQHASNVYGVVGGKSKKGGHEEREREERELEEGELEERELEEGEREERELEERELEERELEEGEREEGQHEEGEREEGQQKEGQQKDGQRKEGKGKEEQRKEGKREKRSEKGSEKRSEKRNAKRRVKTRKEVEAIRSRIRIFYEACPADREKEKRVLAALDRSYHDFSLMNDFRRMVIFLRHYKLLLTVKKYSKFRKYLFCLKMFVKVK